MGAPRAEAGASGQEPVSLRLIASKLERLTWRRRLWGVDERQVWHVVQRLDEMYRQLYHDQEVAYQALLSQAQGAGAQAQPQASQRSSSQVSITTNLSAARQAVSQPPQAPLTPGSHRFRTS